MNIKVCVTLPGTSKEAVVLGDPGLHFCSEHLEPFRESWPSGYPLIAFVTLRQMLADEGLQRVIGKKWTADKATKALVRLSPLCCYLEPKGWPRWAELALANDIAGLQRLGVGPA